MFLGAMKDSSCITLWLDFVSNVFGRDEGERVDGTYVPHCVSTVPTTCLMVPTTPATHTSGDGTYIISSSEEQTLGADISVKEMVC
jgi:hypothetical protein